MAGYTHRWQCESCGSSEDTIDRPRVELCERCDNRTKLRCLVCRQFTNVTPQDLHRQRRGGAVHAVCVVAEPEPEPVPEPVSRWDTVPS